MQFIALLILFCQLTPVPCIHSYIAICMYIACAFSTVCCMRVNYDRTKGNAYKVVHACTFYIRSKSSYLATYTITWKHNEQYRKRCVLHNQAACKNTQLRLPQMFHHKRKSIFHLSRLLTSLQRLIQFLMLDCVPLALSEVVLHTHILLNLCNVYICNVVIIYSYIAILTTYH